MVDPVFDLDDAGPDSHLHRGPDGLDPVRGMKCVTLSRATGVSAQVTIGNDLLAKSTSAGQAERAPARDGSRVNDGCIAGATCRFRSRRRSVPAEITCWKPGSP